jgi:hypothetical protein
MIVAKMMIVAWIRVRLKPIAVLCLWGCGQVCFMPYGFIVVKKNKAPRQRPRAL